LSRFRESRYTHTGPPHHLSGRGTLHISRETVEEACADLGGLREAVRHAFAGVASGEAKALPKANLDLGVGHFFQAMVAADSRTDLAAVKWVAVAPVDGATVIRSHIMLSRRSTGELLATMEADPITAARTAAMSAIAAEHLARPDSASIAFIGCGTQARSHLAALASILPGLSRVIAYSRRPETAAAFAADARRAGFEAEAVDDPRSAIEGADVVVSSVSIGGLKAPFVDAAWLAPGTFVTAVDLARPWHSESFRHFDLVATDERQQSQQLAQKGRMPFAGTFDADLCDLAQSRTLLRLSPSQRTLFVFAGHALADLAVAGFVYDYARNRHH
jgi:ornithine cyclodeaminase/alanine dehydrogenase